MRLVVICNVLLLPTVCATAFGFRSAVITSQDVKEGLTASKINLTFGHNYRVYAVFASSAPSDAYASNVFVKGYNGGQFTIADLAKPKSGTDYILDDERVLLAPITVTNLNEASVEPVSFTIYAVAGNYRKSPVVSAQLVNGRVDSSLAKLSATSVTVLSAEKNVELSGFDMSSLAELEIKSVGFDSVANDYTIMTVTKQAPRASVVISGPIATLYNPSAAPTNFKFNIERDAMWSRSLGPNESITLLSNGFMNLWESYAVEANKNPLTRGYDVGVGKNNETEVWFNPAVGNYYPDSGDSLKFSCRKANGQNVVYNLAELAGSVQKDTCVEFDLDVTVGTQTPTGPRFIVEVATGPAGFPWALTTLD